MIENVLFSSKSEEWETPQWLFDDLKFGHSKNSATSPSMVVVFDDMVRKSDKNAKIR